MTVKTMTTNNLQATNKAINLQIIGLNINTNSVTILMTCKMWLHHCSYHKPKISVNLFVRFSYIVDRTHQSSYMSIIHTLNVNHCNLKTITCTANINHSCNSINININNNKPNKIHHRVYKIENCRIKIKVMFSHCLRSSW